HPVDRLQVLDRGAEQPLQRAEVVDQPVDDRTGQPGYLGQQPEAARRHGHVERVGGARVTECLADRHEIDEVGGRQHAEGFERVLQLPQPGAGGQVVADDQDTVGVHPGHELFELQGQQAAVGTQFDDVPGDLVGDPPYHLQPLDHGHRVPHEIAGYVVEL